MATGADTNLIDPIVFQGCVYYSQNKEDLILQSFFPDVTNGFYVDVGAFDPDVDSVTKLFYKQGWRGINIEPQLARFSLFEKKRKRDVNLNIGVAEKEGQLVLRTYKSGGLSTFDETIKSQYEKQPDNDTRDYREYTIAVRPLREVLKEQGVDVIHFLKVDVEGLEYEVLASNNWDKFRPQVLCIEANHVSNDWHPLLQMSGYELVFNDGLNEYFVDQHTNRKDKFNFVKDIITDRGGGIRFDHFEVMMAWKREAGRQQTRADYVENHKQLLAVENDAYRTQLNAYRNIRYATGALIRLVVRKVGRGLLRGGK